MAQPQPVQASRQKPVAAEMMKDEKYGSAGQIMSLPAAKLIALLQDGSASVYAKARRSSWVMGRIRAIADMTGELDARSG